MANTTNFGWETPDDTDLVKDGASAMRTLGNAIDTSLVDLKGGTTGQVLSKASNTDMDFTWVAQDDSNAIQNAIVDAKGDLITATAADTPSRIAVGTNGQVLSADSTTATGLKWITPATARTWTSRLQTTITWSKIEYNGSNLWVAVAEQGNLYTSADGITWTSRTSGFGTNQIHDVSYGNGLWVVVGANGTITTSSDGITWTARTSNMSTNTIRSVIYANSLWVAVGDGGGTTNTGGITYSSDGITWTRKSQSLTVGARYRTVAYNGTNWVVAGDISTNNYLYASTPSGTWTAGTTGGGGDVYKLYWDGTRHITIETANYAYRYSTSTTLGTTTAYARTPQATVSYNGWSYLYNGTIYAQNGVYLQTFPTASTASVVTSMPELLPTWLIQVSTWLSQPNCAIWAGSSGLILASENGIWTTF